MQKIMVVSDTHRHHENLKKAIKLEGPIDMLIHLGDAEGEEDYIRELADCEVIMIAGNNDYFSNLRREITIKIGKYNVLLTHGHYYYVSVGLDFIKEEAIGRRMDIVMFGHTHRPIIEIYKEVTLINPGSISYPRQNDKKPTYIIMDIDDDENINYTLKHVNIGSTLF